ncbi:MAG: GspH/FimT family pseudopilin [Xanthomonadales bacterium]|nr:hypothetical protein [Xanthomonadales bacterium]MCC6592299.1 GspH/FimT family pseudopilin [Xanthomonadales bacterium]MCE7931644.1 prepilin-type N-terminal cleavage/methylation domain-containing protein [Xanthomonadales bacterium PRO6]
MHRPCHATGRNRGYSLYELLVVIAILTILATVGLPSMRRLHAAGELRAATSLLVVGLQRARADALMSGRETVLCPSANGHQCMDGSDWSGGWILYRDLNRNHRFDAVEPLLLSQALQAGRVRVRSNDGRRRVIYRRLGEAAGSNVTFVLCNRDLPGRGVRVIVANSGRVRLVHRPADDGCQS